MTRELVRYLALSGLAAACTAAPQSVVLETGTQTREIAVLEDARDSGSGRLQELLEQGDAGIRARAATALGRLPYPEQGGEVTRALLEALTDPNPAVRATAAFALGLRGDPSAGDKLAFVALDDRDADGDPLVRARAIEALSKLDRPDLRIRTLDALRDPDERARLEAAEGAHRWSRDEQSAELVDRRLVEHLGHDTHSEVIWMTLFALQRREAPAAEGAFVHYAESPVELERLFAVRGLRALAPSEGVRAALERSVRDPDWRMACEATAGLGEYELGESTKPLIEATRHSSPHVRRTAWEALLARMSRIDAMAPGSPWSPIFETMAPYEDPSPAVRAAFGAALTRYRSLTGPAQLSLGQFALSVANERWSSEDWVALALSFAYDKTDPGVPQALALLARNADPRVAGTALQSLGQHPSGEVRSVLHKALASPDNGLRLAAVLALRDMPDESDVAPLSLAFRTSEGDIAPEIRFNVLRNAGVIRGDTARKLLVQGLIDPEPYVRRVANEELAAGWPTVHIANAALAVPPVTPDPVPWPGQDFPAYTRNPRAEIETTKGTLLFELFPGEAPTHVYSFLTLAARGHYDGTLFHRVVPDFVIQGGDYRGDGNGGTTYRGVGSLRHEIGPRKYVRGSLGMPRNEDPDSGGSQIFVTHRPTPHLDGRYTIFGELRRGFDVLDAIEVGDRILGVRLEGKGAQ